jgi:hypothetical protein
MEKPVVDFSKLKGGAGGIFPLCCSSGYLFLWDNRIGSEAPEVEATPAEKLVSHLKKLQGYMKNLSK